LWTRLLARSTSCKGIEAVDVAAHRSIAHQLSIAAVFEAHTTSVYIMVANSKTRKILVVDISVTWVAGLISKHCLAASRYLLSRF
jgi:hypothetical protein